ncbi:hypothetical protein C8R45DRAFT_875882 [Mycena sanguinolenta]|nr:hypothetical protein C8R45DRAFT_875882 [Mycena sanguinolenta]
MEPSASTSGHASAHSIWQWTLKPEAVAPCFVQDVFDLEQSGTREEFFWLGRIPCRTVKLVALLVGVEAHESRVIYHLDDGTGVIACVHRPPPPNQSKQEKTKEPLPLLKPTAYVGSSVVVIGRVIAWNETRRILVDSIVRCSSSNDEPNHWIAVGALHRTHYYIEEPFVLRSAPPLQMPTPTDSRTAAVPASSSPLKSPAKSSLPRLRHPSKLHTHDLTDNAFRIYLKHYMDYADDVQPLVPEPSTPTKSSRNALPPTDEPLAPRADDTICGFTLSHLRRVPELALMAKRVVKAEAKRRAREAKKREKEARPGAPPKKPTQAMLNDQQKLHPRMKRLFNWAIFQLMKEGDVISWEGPVRPYRTRDPNEALADPDSSALWKLNSSNSTVGANSTLFSNASIAEDDEDEGELSDPQSGEEAFISLTPSFLATVVENAIRTFVEQAAAHAPTRMADSNGSRIRAPAAGPTVSQIVSLLKRDDTWRNLSEFTVKEALGRLKDEGRAWTSSGDRWQLSM